MMNFWNKQMNTLNSLTVKPTYTVKGTVSTIDHEVLKSWLVQDENGNYSIDESKEKAFIEQLADQIDTYGKSRKFTTHDGAQITLATNRYGWQVDREKSLENLKTALAEGKEQEMELSYSHKAKGTSDNDLGDVYVEISIDRQTMWCYKNGQLVVETPVVTGDISKEGRATPKNGCWRNFLEDHRIHHEGARKMRTGNRNIRLSFITGCHLTVASVFMIWRVVVIILEVIYIKPMAPTDVSILRWKLQKLSTRQYRWEHR